ncbi:MAG: COX15/CtaA family protein [Gemmatimonadaceae bacterium]
MTSLRRLAYAALVLAYLQIVFGAVVRITGSGMGCGDHWPRCMGQWMPPLDRPDLIIEITHRYIAAALSAAVVALAGLAIARRRAPSVAGSGVVPAAGLAAALVLTAAVLGAITVKVGLHPLVIVAHLAVAMSLLATLVTVVLRSGGLGASSVTAGSGTAKSYRGALAAGGLAFAVLILGALTANLPGAATSCLGFPHCRLGSAAGGGLHVQLGHRVLAVLLALHVTALAVAIGKRSEPVAVRRASRLALAAIVLQIVIAAVLVESGLPPVLQSLHQGAGTLVWLAIVALATLAGRARPLTATAGSAAREASRRVEPAAAARAGVTSPRGAAS